MAPGRAFYVFRMIRTLTPFTYRVIQVCYNFDTPPHLCFPEGPILKPFEVVRVISRWFCLVDPQLGGAGSTSHSFSGQLGIMMLDKWSITLGNMAKLLGQVLGVKIVTNPESPYNETGNDPFVDFP